MENNDFPSWAKTSFIVETIVGIVALSVGFVFCLVMFVSAVIQGNSMSIIWLAGMGFCGLIVWVLFHMLPKSRKPTESEEETKTSGYQGD